MSARIRHQHSASVFVVLLRGQDACLFRRKATGWMDGYFSVPAGGLDAGETIAAAAIREVREEVDVRVSAADLIYAHTLHSFTEGADWVGHFFTTTRWVGSPRIREPDKHVDLAWRPIQNPPRETIPYVSQALNCIARGRLYSEFGWGNDPPAQRTLRP